MNRTLAIACLACLPAVAGCGTQGVLLGVEGSYLLTVMDALAVPGEPVEAAGRLQQGDLLRPGAGYVLRFRRDGELWKAAQTDADGKAAVEFTPPEPGDYRIEVAVAPIGPSEPPPEPRTLLIACRPPDEPMAVVDLDKTVVASGFEEVLLGDPAPMTGSQDVLRRLAGDHTIIYLTHRPEYFGPKSKAWLNRHGYPSGPVLLSTLGGFLEGSGEFKTAELRRLRQKFSRIEIGVGDKFSDARSYHENGMTSVLIVQPSPDMPPEELEGMIAELETLPDAIHVVTDWREVSRVLFDDQEYPPRRMLDRVTEMLAEAVAGNEGDKEGDGE